MSSNCGVINTMCLEVACEQAPKKSASEASREGHPRPESLFTG